MVIHIKFILDLPKLILIITELSASGYFIVRSRLHWRLLNHFRNCFCTTDQIRYLRNKRDNEALMYSVLELLTVVKIDC